MQFVAAENASRTVSVAVGKISVQKRECQNENLKGKLFSKWVSKPEKIYT